ncbi:MAG: fibronectin type III domain-containing protein [Planctomycetes bacterium]|nr:fibronectin type III domain-containing protein [Planctomycetota bacterium]
MNAAHASLTVLLFVIAPSSVAIAPALLPAGAPRVAGAPALPLPLDTWVKLSPKDGAPPSPRLGYEGACAWDGARGVLIRYGGHNQGGGGEQGSEVWTFEPVSARWTLKEADVSPPGVCCNQQNVFDPVRGRYLRFPSFSGSHGWQWWRELYVNDSSVWSYDLATSTWRNLRPLPAASPKGLRCASWDAHHGVVVIFGGETSREGTIVYDPHANTWRWMRPPVEPDFRSGGNMAYDVERRLHILFGSQFSDDPHTWAYDLARNEWRDMRPEVLPPSDQNDAVLTYDPFRKVVIAIVKITRGKDEEARHRLETWTYDAGANRWRKLGPAREPDPSGSRARVLVFAPELDAALLENRTHPPQGDHEQQVWALRLSGPAAGAPPAEAQPAGAPPAGAPRAEERPESPAPRPEPPFVEDGVMSVLSASEVEVTWRPPPGPAAAACRYHVERAAVEVLSEDQLRRLKSRTPPLEEPSAGAIVKIGPFQRLTPSPLKEARYADREVDISKPLEVRGEPVYDRALHEEHVDKAGRPYRFAVLAYRVRAVDEKGVESGPSPAFFTLPAPPRRVFAKEEGETCRLRWEPSPEKGLKGYRVYRMDGRYDSEKVTRLTPEPVSGTSFADPDAGKKTRRYQVVAVDALGQEGLPSSPVWHEREWKRFYEPFAGLWHQ